MYQPAKPENLPQIQIDEDGELSSLNYSSFEVLEEVDEPGEYHEDPFAEQIDVVEFKRVRIHHKYSLLLNDIPR